MGHLAGLYLVSIWWWSCFISRTTPPNHPFNTISVFLSPSTFSLSLSYNICSTRLCEKENRLTLSSPDFPSSSLSLSKSLSRLDSHRSLHPFYWREEKTRLLLAKKNPDGLHPGRRRRTESQCAPGLYISRRRMKYNSTRDRTWLYFRLKCDEM